MKAPLCNSVRTWAPLFALLAAGCGLPAYRFGDLRVPTRKWEAQDVVATGHRVYVSNKEGSAVLAVDPASLEWREVGRVRRLAGFDMDAAGLWALERRDDPGGFRLRGPGRPERLIDADGGATPQWTVGHMVLWGTAGTLSIPKSGGPEARVEHPPALRLLGVDYSLEILWATLDRRLLTLNAGDSDWRPARLHLEGSSVSGAQMVDRIEALGFGQSRFALLIEGLIYSGRSSPGELMVERALDLPGLVERIVFNARDKDVLLAWTARATWAWDLAGRQGVKFPPSERFYYDPRRQRGVVILKEALALSPLDGPEPASRPVVLDACAVTINGLWGFLTCPVDFGLGTAIFCTPAGFILQPFGLARPFGLH